MPSARAHWLAGPAQTAVRLKTGGQSLAVGLHGAVSDNDIERTYAPTPLTSTALVLECSNRLLWARSRIGRCKRSHPLLLAPLLRRQTTRRSAQCRARMCRCMFD